MYKASISKEVAVEQEVNLPAVRRSGGRGNSVAAWKQAPAASTEWREEHPARMIISMDTDKDNNIRSIATVHICAAAGGTL